MANASKSGIAVIAEKQDELLKAWLAILHAAGISSDRRTSAAESEAQARSFLSLLIDGARGGSFDTSAEVWAPMRDFLDEFSRSRALQGFPADTTAFFVLSLKRALFDLLQGALTGDVKSVTSELWTWVDLIDKLAVYTIGVFQKSREDVIKRQQGDLLELSTPVIKLWEGVLALPMIGTLDSSRTQIVMETLLQRIVETGSTVAILDITGVPTVDTLVAQHLMKTVTAIRLMGADCIISGIRPQIAQTIVHLGIDLSGITTKANLADALAVAMQRTSSSSTL
jgi:rsbT co-antagonist protein RsbR